MAQTGISKIVEILVNRDKMDPWDAEGLIKDTRNEIFDCISRGGNLDEVEEIIYDYLGLEPDYLENLGILY